ncbi:GNAT family N-acetyltransferase [Fredinandcohnia humi]
MENFQLISNYKNNDAYRANFNELAKNIFGIQFEDWYQQGFWNERYIPYSFVDGEKVIANVSINLFDIILHGKHVNGLQVGTVMTHPDYRNRGLSAKLLKKVFEDFDDTCDFMYLFANQSVLEFYPKFGFRSYKESLFEIEVHGGQNKLGTKLNPLNSKDLKFIYEFVKRRVPVSSEFGITHGEDVFMFHAMYGFPDDIYYFAEENAIVIYQVQEDILHLFDVISDRLVSLQSLISKLAPSNVKKAVLHFTPNDNEYKVNPIPYEPSDVFFIRTKKDIQLPTYVKHPITSQA